VFCFLFSLFGFLLAWAPPVRRLFSSVLRRRFLVLGCLVTVIALFYAVENWRGRRAWHQYVQRGEAKGEHFDVASLAPPPIPDAENFFEAPLWNFLHFTSTDNHTVWAETNWGQHVVLDVFGPKSHEAPSSGNWLKSQHVDLAAWQAYYRGSNNWFAAPGGGKTNYFPIANEPQMPAADVLLALSRFETNRQTLIAAAARPYSRFWINYEAGPAMLLPHLSRLKGCAQYLSLHAQGSLSTGQKEAALEDVKLLFRLMESVRGEPILISHLVRIAVLQIALQPVWEGIVNRQWTDGELRQIESELGKLDFLADYQAALRGDRACGLWALDYVHKNGLDSLDDFFNSEPNTSVRPEWEKFLARALFRLVPAGWFDQNRLSFCRTLDSWMRSAVDDKTRVISPARVEQSEAVLCQPGFMLYDVLSARFLPSLSRSVQRFARGQASADLARVVCALERYRLANSQYPEFLEALAPKFIENLPHDVINGQPLKYRRADNGHFVLYSVGWNQTDDGGKVERTKGGAIDPNKGDWVWPSEAGS
jgi:hypothetical protein